MTKICLPCTEVIAPALPELLWLPTVWRCPYIEIAFSTLDCPIVPTCGAWCSATAAKRGPLKQSWAEIQHSRDDEPLGVLMQTRNIRVNGFFFFSSLGVLPGVLVDTLWHALRAGLLCCNFFGQPGSVSKFPPLLWVKLWVGWVGRGYTEISRYFPASWINWVTLVTKMKLLYSLRF